MPLINKLTNCVLDFLFILRLRPLFTRHKKEMKKLFELPGTQGTYWIECIHENFTPPEQVKIINSNQTEINTDAKDLVKNWQVLPNPIKNKLTPLVNHLMLCRRLWYKKNYGEFSSHSVSDHVYEM